MASNTTKDMTSGSTMKLILGFAVPLLMGMLFQQVYSLVDTIGSRRSRRNRKYQLSDRWILSGNL